MNHIHNHKTQSGSVDAKARHIYLPIGGLFQEKEPTQTESEGIKTDTPFKWT